MLTLLHMQTTPFEHVAAAREDWAGFPILLEFDTIGHPVQDSGNLLHALSSIGETLHGLFLI